MHEPIYSSAEHKALIEGYINMCTQFVKDVSSKNRYQNFLDVIDIVFEYHNNYGKGVKENNFYDWIMIIPINLSVATSGYFAALETKRNAAVVRAYKLVLNEALQDTVDKLDLIEPKSE